MRIKKLIKSKHYEIFHEHEVSWNLVVPLVLTSKNKRKVGDKIRILNKGYYFLGIFKNGTFIVINAKKK